MRQSSLLKWAQSNKNKNGRKQWIHPPETLKCGHIAYLVKFLGHTEVDLPKGIEVIKEGIRKLKFNQQIRISENGSSAAKIPKYEVTISIDGVAIQEPKTKRIYHQYPLHRISYCADDKAEKRFFSFIAKEEDSNKHTCFVFVSDKLAEEITLTIGQAFDLAYRRFLETSGRDLEIKKQMMVLQKRIQALEQENHVLQVRLMETEKLKNKEDVEKLKNSNYNSTSSKISRNGSNNLIKANNVKNKKTEAATSPNGTCNELVTIQPPPIPPRSSIKSPNETSTPSQDLCDLTPDVEVGRKLENLALNDLEDFNPRGQENGNGISNEKEKKDAMNGTNNNHITEETDLFGAKPFSPSKEDDPFKMGKFDEKDLENAIGVLDKRITEMRDGFSRGLTLSNGDFSLENLDPLNEKTS